VLWKGLEFDYGGFVDQIETLKREFDQDRSDHFAERLEEMMQAF
jgi:hypothetical protein